MPAIIDIRDYDRSLLRRFQFFYPNTVWINRASVEIAEIRDNAIYEGQDIHFPVLILRRTQCPILYKDTNPYAQYKTGDRHTDGMSAEEIKKAKIPDDLTIVNSVYELQYTLEILSADRDNFDELVIEAQENLLRFPYLTFDSDDPILKGQSSHLIMQSCQDNSDLDSFDDHTPLYRASIQMTLRAYIYRKYRRFAIDEFYLNMTVKDTTDDNKQKTVWSAPPREHAEHMIPESIKKVLDKNKKS